MGNTNTTCSNLPSCIPEQHVPLLNADVNGISKLMLRLETTMHTLPQIDQLVVDMTETVHWMQLCLLIITIITCFAITMVTLFAVCLCGYYTRKLRQHRAGLKKKFSAKYGDGSGRLKASKNTNRIRQTSLYARTRLSTIAESVADGSARTQEQNLSD